MDIAPYLYGLAIAAIICLLYIVSTLRNELEKQDLNRKIELLQESEGQRELEENYNQDFLQMEESLNRNKSAVDYLYNQLEIQAGENPMIGADGLTEYRNDIDVALDIIARGGNPSEQTSMPADEPDTPFDDFSKYNDPASPSYVPRNTFGSESSSDDV